MKEDVLEDGIEEFLLEVIGHEEEELVVSGDACQPVVLPIVADVVVDGFDGVLWERVLGELLQHVEPHLEVGGLIDFAHLLVVSGHDLGEAIEHVREEGDSDDHQENHDDLLVVVLRHVVSVPHRGQGRQNEVAADHEPNLLLPNTGYFRKFEFSGTSINL